MPWELAALYIYSYLIGALPTPYLVARLVKGIDLREYGSGNVGGSNLARQLGKKWVLPLSLFEFLFKGVSPILAGLVFLAHVPGLERTSPLFLAAPLLALIGNNWSVFLRFQGGRGIMVICGMLAALAPLLFLAGLLIYLVGWRITRSSGVWALAAVAALPLLAWLPGGWLTLGWPSLLPALTDPSAWTIPAGEAFVISWYCAVILALVVLKRLLSNSMTFPEDISRKKVLFNRLFRDRDLDSRTEWVGRIPDEP